jgi:2-methylcitrate dehydratase PrpD
MQSTTETKPGATEKVARFIVDTHFDDMPPEVVRTAKRPLLDALGVALAGSVSPQGRIMIEHAKEEGGTAESAVVGGGFRTSASGAVFANGTLVHALDFDDTWLPLGHPTCVVFPVVFALAEKLKLGGKEILEAFILGMEVIGKVGFGHSTHPFHSTPIYGSLGAAASASKMLGLDLAQTRMALGIASSGAGGLGCNVGTMTKPLHAGNAARNGLVSAMLAGRGFTANRRAIEDRRGFGAAFIGETYTAEKAAANLGKPFHILSPGIGVKTYPTCYLNYRPLDALLQIMAQQNISHEAVESVEVWVPHEHFLNNPDPQTGLEGKFSLQYNLATALLDGKIEIDTFRDDRMDRPGIAENLEKIKLEIHPELPADYAHCLHPVTVILKDGRRFTGRTDTPKGHWENPLTDEELRAKYLNNACLVLPAELAERSIELIGKLEDLEGIEALASIYIRTCA